MSHDMIFLQMLILYILWVCGPLIPAVLIYRLFPDTKVVANGPLAGLTIRAGGAFAAYVIVFLLAYPICLKMQEVFGGQLRPYWTVKASVVARDDSGQPITYSNFYSGMTVSFSPSIQVIAGREVTLKVPMDGEGKEWPRITFNVPGYGGVTIDPEAYRNSFEVDDFRKTIKIHGEIALERFTPAGIGIAPSPVAISGQ